MQLAKVMGSVVSTQKSSTLHGKKLLLVQSLNAVQQIPLDKNPEVAVDSVGAGDGDVVLVVRGGAARMVFDDPHAAIDLSIVAIVDSIDT